MSIIKSDIPDETKAQMLIEQYYQAISLMEDKKALEEAFPESNHYLFEEIIKGLIDKLQADIEFYEGYIFNGGSNLDLEDAKKELNLSIYKKDYCTTLLNNAAIREKEKQEFVSGGRRNLIFAKRNSGGSYLLKDVSSNDFSENYYSKVASLIDELKNGELVNPEKFKALAADSTIDGVMEARVFKIRLYYRLLGGNNAFVIMAAMKKGDNPTVLKKAIRLRVKHTNSEYERLKKLFQNKEIADKIVLENEIVESNILAYLEANKRGR